MLACAISSKINTYFTHVLTHSPTLTLAQTCNCCDNHKKIISFLEIQRGKEAMNGEKFGKYAKDIGATAAFVKRTIEATENSCTRLEERREAADTGKSDLYYGDSWFAGVTAAVEASKLGHNFLAQSKVTQQDSQTKRSARCPRG